jgi:hypothetical protein
MLSPWSPAILAVISMKKFHKGITINNTSFAGSVVNVAIVQWAGMIFDLYNTLSSSL